MANTRETLGDQETLDGLISDTLEEFEENEITTIYTGAVQYRENLKRVRFPNVNNIQSGAFMSTGIEQIRNEDFPNLTNIPERAFYLCTSLKSVATEAKILSIYAFEECEDLEYVELNGQNIELSYSFKKCHNLKSLKINSDDIPYTRLNNLNYTKINSFQGAIYVPDNMVDEYRKSSRWSKYFIYSNTEYPLTKYPNPDIYYNHVGTITERWEEIIFNSNYKEDYKIGYSKPVYIRGLGVFLAYIVGMDYDIRGDGNSTLNEGKTCITWLIKEIVESKRINHYKYSFTGWDKCDIHELLKELLLKFPIYLRNGIIPTSKRVYISKGNYDITIGSVWILSPEEVNRGIYEGSGIVYSNIFNGSNSSLYIENKFGSYDNFWLRANSPYYVTSNGTISSTSYFDYTYGIVPGFCTGYSIDYEINSWNNLIFDILRNNIMYYIGDIMYITINNTRYSFEIIGFNKDVDENGDLIPLTLSIKDVYDTQCIVSNDIDNGNWETSTLRNTYLSELYDLLPSYVSSIIVPASKSTYNKDINSIKITKDKLWLFSSRELNYLSSSENTGVIYDDVFLNDQSRIKSNSYWLRSSDKNIANNNLYITNTGSIDTASVNTENGLVFGFCVGSKGYYGVEWDYSKEGSKLTRIGLAKNFVDPIPATSLTETGSSPFDNISPWKDMRICSYVSLTDEFVYDDDERFDMNADNIMVYIPEFYYFSYKDETNTKWRWLISSTPQAGFKKHPGSGRYVGRYHANISDGIIHSKSGTFPELSANFSTIDSRCKANGSGWYMLDIATWSAIQMLYLVEFADFNSQTSLGTGQNGGNIVISGRSDNAIYHTIKRNGDFNQYRYIEDPYSNVFDYINGCLMIYDRGVYIGTNNSEFNESYSKLEYAKGFKCPTTSGYISGFNYSSDYDWVFIAKSASNTRQVSDYTFSPISNLGYNMIVGGSCNINDNKYGMFFHDPRRNYQNNIYNDTSTRLIYIPQS